MKNLSRNQTIGVFAGLGILAYVLFAGNLVGIFGFSNNNQETNMQESSVSGVEVRDISVGSGRAVEAGDVVTVHYVGTLSDGRVFDSSLDRNTPFSFTVGAGQVIRGWEEGIPGMQVGGKRTLIISPDYGYGSQGVGPIPPNSTLIFEVELINIESR